jgi:hypothetical protein
MNTGSETEETRGLRSPLKIELEHNNGEKETNKTAKKARELWLPL